MSQRHEFITVTPKNITKLQMQTGYPRRYLRELMETGNPLFIRPDVLDGAS